MKLIIILAFLVIATVCYGEEFTLDYDIKLTNTYVVWSTNRDALLEYQNDSFPMVLVLDDKVNGFYYKQIYETINELPMGDVYLMNGRWLIHYEQNKGYMPKWIKVNPTLRER